MKIETGNSNGVAFLKVYDHISSLQETAEFKKVLHTACTSSVSVNIFFENCLILPSAVIGSLLQKKRDRQNSYKSNSEKQGAKRLSFEAWFSGYFKCFYILTDVYAPSPSFPPLLRMTESGRIPIICDKFILPLHAASFSNTAQRSKHGLRSCLHTIK